MFTDIHRIELALGRHSCTEALTWCSENKAALRKLKVGHISIHRQSWSLFSRQSTLEFDLRLQEYIELSRARLREDAISYMRKHLVPWQDTHMVQIRQASGLLAFSSDTLCNPYKVCKVTFLVELC